jgi:dihydroflavonol-4-reductase
MTNQDWTDLSVATAYEKSKTLAEKAAWDFIGQLPEADRFEVVTINPGLVLGPSLVECKFSSGDIIKKIMTGGMPGMPKIQFPVVDVRDVAKAHLQAVLVPEAAGQRFILVNEGVWFLDIGKWLHEKWGRKYKCVHTSLPKFLLTLATLWDEEARTVRPFWGKINTFDNSNTKGVLGIRFTDMKHSVLEMSETLVELGYID